MYRLDVYSRCTAMLSLENNSLIGEIRLRIQSDLAQAWISYYPPLLNPRNSHDWRLWLRHKPYEAARACPSQTRLLIESRLRAWLLQRFRKKLRDMRFAELCRIAERAGRRGVERRA